MQGDTGVDNMASLELHSCMHSLNGLVVPRFVTQENLEKMRDIKIRNDDVWIVMYPKAGLST